MLKLILILLLSSLGISVPLNSPRIVNGSDSYPGQFPYIVSVRYFDKHECGGSIINEKWILTAAHCIYQNFVQQCTILFGTIYVQDGEKPLNNTRQVKRAIVHENYAPYGGYENDIALLELETPITFNEFTQPLSLPEQGKETPVGHSATLVGWGYNHDNGTVMPILQSIELLVYSDEECVERHNHLTNPLVHICVGTSLGGNGQCNGDSGGPLTVNGVQYGVVSWSDRPCSTNLGVMTKVSHYIKWIQDHISWMILF